jgi:hypothetical protein
MILFLLGFSVEFVAGRGNFQDDRKKQRGIPSPSGALAKFVVAFRPLLSGAFIH